MSRDHILPLPLYVHYAEMEGNKRVSEICEDSDGFHLEKLTPMRIFGTILEIHGDETISFQWGKDKRNLQEYQKTLNQFYDVQPLEDNINLKEETTYIVHYDDNYYRCRVVDVYSIGDTKTVYLIDYGKTVKIDDADFFYFHHEESWSDESLCFAFAGICRIADKNQ
uniref:Tudor domain-containing protein n=1 Tax=Panagrolaimus superbus TaxID=310955 RepID=A0A914ZHY3_9BILA